jgi:putative membrane protein
MESDTLKKPDVTALAQQRNSLAKQRTDWAALRTRLGSERTMMAAIRTSLSLIGFGFTIVTFFEAVRKATGDAGPVRVYSPRRMGLTLVSLGIFVMIAFAVQHWLFLKKLRKDSDLPFPWSVSMTAAAGLALIGIIAFVTILVRI